MKLTHGPYTETCEPCGRDGDDDDGYCEAEHTCITARNAWLNGYQTARASTASDLHAMAARLMVLRRDLVKQRERDRALVEIILLKNLAIDIAAHDVDKEHP